MGTLLSDADLIERIFQHSDNKTTDTGDRVWREPTVNYQSPERFEQELKLMRRLPVPYCPSAALPKAGSYIAREAAGVPLLVVRDNDGVVRAFKNACRHRGMQVAEGEGCSKAFVCPYHAWAYGLDGALKHIPGADGFPDIDVDMHGLVPVHHVEERAGLVIVTQEEPVASDTLDDVPEIIAADQVYLDMVEIIDQANWKLIGETSMEGYHIKALHNRSFYPYGYDNLNVVETYGPNSRIIFPFNRIEKLRDVPPEERRLDGMVTAVYQMFPNTHVTMLSSHSLLIVLEPLSPTETKWIIYRVGNKVARYGSEVSVEEAKRDAKFVKDTGLDEDRHAARSIQASLATGANDHFTFGKFEKAIGHFHSNLHDYLARLDG